VKYLISLLILVSLFIGFLWFKTTDSTVQVTSGGKAAPGTVILEKSTTQPHDLFQSDSVATNDQVRDEPEKTIKTHQLPDCYKELEQQSYDTIRKIDQEVSPEDVSELLLLTGFNSFKRLLRSEENKTEQSVDERIQRALSRYDLLKQTYQEKQDGFTAFLLLDGCSTTKGFKDQCDESLIDELAATHSDNGYLQLYVIDYYHGRDQQKQVAAMQTMLRANEFNIYRKEHITAIYDVLATQPIEPILALFSTIGIDAARWLPLNKIVNFCDENSYPEVCLQVGQHLVTMGKYVFFESMGYLLQQKYWEQNNNSDAAKSIKEQGRKSAESFYQHVIFQTPVTNDFVTIYLNALEQESEREFVQQLHERIKQYLEENPDVCVI
jgi:hypothetical protein